jgi:hypothetical protein
MGSAKKKESLVVKPIVSPVTIISTLKQQPPKEQGKPEANQDQMARPAGDREIKGTPVKAGEKVVEKQHESSKTDQPDVPVSKKKSVASSSQDDTYNFKVSVPEHTGKEKQRNWEWVKFKTQIKVKLVTGDIYQGYLRWYDRYAVKLITANEEIVIPKHSIVCIFDEPKSKPEVKDA